ncbi:hypothetical protein [Lunatimonas salinarum]|uniref:hypothetical protein n=1 Tax=Lunatimonas salinarum TaxID=1774590 RepID=UPI001ADEE502|nr:hypothetical protein [Lunatimonas salinarum]
MRRQMHRKFQSILIGFTILLMVLVGYFLIQSPVSNQEEYIAADAPIPLDQIEDRVVDGVHVGTGLLAGDGLRLVIAHCTACHSAQLIIQNRADRAGWEKMIRWMQQTQNLWELGSQEAVILDYLSTYYAPEEANKGVNFRRVPLKDIEWYELKD